MERICVVSESDEARSPPPPPPSPPLAVPLPHQQRQECQKCEEGEAALRSEREPTTSRKFTALSSTPKLTPVIAHPVLSEDPFAEENRWLLSYNSDALVAQLQAILLHVNENRQRTNEVLLRTGKQFNRAAVRCDEARRSAWYLKNAGIVLFRMQGELDSVAKHLVEVRKTFVSKARQSSISGAEVSQVVRSLSAVMRFTAIADRESIDLDFLSDELDVELSSRVLRRLCRHLVCFKQLLLHLRRILLDCSPESYSEYCMEKKAVIDWASRRRVIEDSIIEVALIRYEDLMDALQRLLALKYK